MGKLVDKDKFINVMLALYCDAKWSPQDVHFSLLDVKANLESPEFEVDAIPVEWIKRYTKLNPSLKIFIDIMLMDWREANEELV